MRRAAKLSTLGLTLTLALAHAAPARAAALGVLRGIVRDQGGVPLAGASVAIFDVATRMVKPVRATSTGEGGEFEASVAPGRYLLRAVASGFDTVEARARVAANRETVLDTIALRRVGTLADRRRTIDADPYRNVVRGSRPPVFNWDPKSEEERERADAQAIALTDRDNAAHGVLQTVAASGASADYVATNFAVSHAVSKADLTVAGQVGAGEDAPMRLEATTSADLGDAHRMTVAVGYGRLAVGDRPNGEIGTLDQMTIQAVDRWQVAGPLVFVYGLNYSRFSGSATKSATLPRFGVEVSPSNRTQIFASLTPGSAAQQIASFDMETGEVTFVEPPRADVSAARLSEATPDRTRRFEAGAGHVIDERSNVEVAAFFDVASGRGVGFLSAPPSGGDEEFRTGELDGRSSGVRVLYTRKLSEALTATVGYATGRGLALSPNGFEDPASLFRPASYQVVAGQLRADLGTGTHVSAVYRLGPRSVVFAIDPFDGRMAASEPSASVFVTQSIPMPDFVPGQWEAMLDVRNVFDVVPVTDDRELSLADCSRLIRAGLSFRF